MAFSKLFRMKLEEAGISQAEAAERLGCAHSLVNYYARGVKKPGRAEMILKISELINVGVDTLVRSIADESK